MPQKNKQGQRTGLYHRSNLCSQQRTVPAVPVYIGAGIRRQQQHGDLPGKTYQA